MQIKDHEYYPYLDGFRAIAAFWVILHHINVFFDLHRIFSQPKTLYWATISLHVYHIIHHIALCGYMGVDMFFVISGFLITGLLIGGLENGVNIKRFYIRRSFKILPQYFFAVIIAIIFYLVFIPPYPVNNWNGPHFGHANDPAVWSYLFFLQNYFIHVPMLGHTWSLVVEEHFYLVYPVILWLICRNYKEVYQRRMAIIFVCFFMVILCNLIRFFYFDHGIPSLNIWLRAPIHFQTSLFREDALAVGCLLRLFENKIRDLVKSIKLFPILSVALALLIYSFFYQGKIALGDDPKHVWYAYFLAYMAPVFLMSAMLQGFTPLTLLLENPLLRYIGRNSYGIYLWHYILIFPTVLLVPYLGGAFSVILYVFLAIMVGIFTTTTIERYFLNLRNNLFP